jgi:hypothetical protein
VWVGVWLWVCVCELHETLITLSPFLSPSPSLSPSRFLSTSPSLSPLHSFSFSFYLPTSHLTSLSYYPILSHTSLLLFPSFTFSSPSFLLFLASQPSTFSVRKVTWVLSVCFVRTLCLCIFYACCLFIVIVFFYHGLVSPLADFYAQQITAVITTDEASQKFYIDLMKHSFSQNAINFGIIMTLYFLILANKCVT